MVGPAAGGSENGIPSSIQSAPPAASARMILSVVARSGSPAVIKGISAASPRFFSSANFFSIRLMVQQYPCGRATSRSRPSNFASFAFLAVKLSFCFLQFDAEIIADGQHVFVAAAGEIDDHDLAWSQPARQLEHRGDRMGAFQCRNDAFDLGQ